MSHFKSFLLESVYRLSDKERAGIKQIIDVYKHLLVDIESVKDERDVVALGKIEYEDFEDGTRKTVDVNLVFDDDTYRASFDKDNNVINLNHNVIGSTTNDIIYGALEHELLHAKQHYKKKGSEYTASVRKRSRPNGVTTVRSKRGYYLHPTEFPVHTTVAIGEIQRQYNGLVNRIKVAKREKRLGELKYWTDKKDAFNLFLKTFLKSGGKMPDNISKPIFNRNQTEFIDTLIRNRNNPQYKKHYQKFFNAVFQIYSQLNGD